MQLKITHFKFLHTHPGYYLFLCCCAQPSTASLGPNIDCCTLGSAEGYGTQVCCREKYNADVNDLFFLMVSSSDLLALFLIPLSPS